MVAFQNKKETSKLLRSGGISRADPVPVVHVVAAKDRISKGCSLIA